MTDVVLASELTAACLAAEGASNDTITQKREDLTVSSARRSEPVPNICEAYGTRLAIM